jgi:hypothetical protein
MASFLTIWVTLKVIWVTLPPGSSARQAQDGKDARRLTPPFEQSMRRLKGSDGINSAPRKSHPGLKPRWRE